MDATESARDPAELNEERNLRTLKYHLLGPSLTKAGQDKVDQSKVSEVIYNASKGSNFFNREEVRYKVPTAKIQHILQRKRQLRTADRMIAELDVSRDLTQHIVHIDCDSFYAAVEQLEWPDLKEVPFAVGSGVLTTCNYIARKYGCRSGVAGFVAKKLCPDLILIKPNFQKYTAKAREVREILASYDPRFESASIDEAYLNITDYCAENGVSPSEAPDQIRREIHDKTKITVSAGIAANKKLAKICSNMDKPNGQYLLPNDRSTIMAFMQKLPTRKVNGIGRVLERELLEIGVKTCGDIYEQRQYLSQFFGDKTFEFLLTCHLGLGRTRIQPAEEYERKSIGTESTFSEISNPEKMRQKIRWTAEELEKDMKRAECKGRTVCLKIKLHTFEVLTRQLVLLRSICHADDLYTAVLPMLTKLEQEFPGMKLRLMGLRCTHLVSTKKPDTMAFGFKRPRNEAEYAETFNHAKIRHLEGDQESQNSTTCVHKPDGWIEINDAKDLGIQAYGRHGKEINPNPVKHVLERQESWWDCPICLRPQTANERQFNEHIDLCLSRQTIRDVAQGHERAQSRTTSPESKKSKTTDKKRGRTAMLYPKEKKLSFG